MSNIIRNQNQAQVAEVFATIARVMGTDDLTGHEHVHAPDVERERAATQIAGSVEAGEHLDLDELGQAIDELGELVMKVANLVTSIATRLDLIHASTDEAHAKLDKLLFAVGEQVLPPSSPSSPPTDGNPPSPT